MPTQTRDYPMELLALLPIEHCAQAVRDVCADLKITRGELADFVAALKRRKYEIVQSKMTIGISAKSWHRAQRDAARYWDLTHGE